MAWLLDFFEKAWKAIVSIMVTIVIPVVLYCVRLEFAVKNSVAVAQDSQVRVQRVEDRLAGVVKDNSDAFMAIQRGLGRIEGKMDELRKVKSDDDSDE